MKLGSVWDRRLLLAGSHKLKNDELFRDKVFIRPDEAPQVRMERIMEGLRKRAESSGRQVFVTDDGVLYINGSNVFFQFSLVLLIIVLIPMTAVMYMTFSAVMTSDRASIRVVSYNAAKRNYVNSLLSTADILCLQEHWLSD